ncbi:MAG: hypothetical protein KAS32_30305 [Candidatus Peribacteraceae bacterium]|nr:hypothetical protein [Candidatus Peribacteraceae bacterium]
MPEKIIIQITKKGSPSYGVGGGAYTNTCAGRWVLDKDLKLKTAIFVKNHGQLANSLQQAIVPLSVGDFIVTGGGNLPVDFENPDFEIHVVRVTEIILKGESAEALIKRVDSNGIEKYAPTSTLEGLAVYHNRDGGLFCTPMQNGVQS